MIDIHAHIIPQVDDGARDMIDAILMAELAEECGVEVIIATPHSHIPSKSGAAGHLERIKKNFLQLREKVRSEKLDLEIYLGMEFFCDSDLEERFREGTVLSMNGTGYLLIEFDFDEQASRIERYIHQVQRSGAMPIIAHPERYFCVQTNPDVAKRWVQSGCLLQMNKGSVLGSFGSGSSRAARRLLERGLYEFVGSDAHSPYRRTTHMGDIREYLENEFGVETARRLTETNARRRFRL